MDEQKPELDDFAETRNLEDYADRLWQQRVKTERAATDSDDDTGSYSPTRESGFLYDSYYSADADAFREPFECTLKRTPEEPLSPGASTTPPAKRSRGRPYKEASVKITCLKPGDKMSSTLSVDFFKLQEEGLGVPKSELVGGIRTSSKLPLTWSAEDMRRHILSLFPRVRTFVYMKCNQGKSLDPLPDSIKPADMRHLLGRSGLYIVPTSPLLPKTAVLRSDMSTVTEAHTSVSSSAGVAALSDQLHSPSSSSKQYWSPVKVSGEHIVNDEGEFRITLDVSNFRPDEISLKTKNNRVVVHARHGERVDEYGIIEREFKRQYILPKDVDPNEVTSSLSTTGILTLKAPKLHKDDTERIIPIHFSLDDS